MTLSRVCADGDSIDHQQFLWVFVMMGIGENQEQLYFADVHLDIMSIIYHCIQNTVK